MQQVKALRESKGLTQKELAEQSGVHPMKISKIEREEIDILNITLRTALALAKALEVPIENLIWPIGKAD